MISRRPEAAVNELERGLHTRVADCRAFEFDAVVRICGRQSGDLAVGQLLVNLQRKETQDNLERLRLWRLWICVYTMEMKWDPIVLEKAKKINRTEIFEEGDDFNPSQVKIEQVKGLLNYLLNEESWRNERFRKPAMILIRSVILSYLLTDQQPTLSRWTWENFITKLKEMERVSNPYAIYTNIKGFLDDLFKSNDNSNQEILLMSMNFLANDPLLSEIASFFVEIDVVRIIERIQSKHPHATTLEVYERRTIDVLTEICARTVSQGCSDRTRHKVCTFLTFCDKLREIYRLDDDKTFAATYQGILTSGLLNLPIHFPRVNYCNTFEWNRSVKPAIIGKFSRWQRDAQRQKSMKLGLLCSCGHYLNQSSMLEVLNAKVHLGVGRLNQNRASKLFANTFSSIFQHENYRYPHQYCFDGHAKKLYFLCLSSHSACTLKKVDINFSQKNSQIKMTKIKEILVLPYGGRFNVFYDLHHLACDSIVMLAFTAEKYSQRMVHTEVNFIHTTRKAILKRFILPFDDDSLVYLCKKIVTWREGWITRKREDLSFVGIIKTQDDTYLCAPDNSRSGLQKVRIIGDFREVYGLELLGDYLIVLSYFGFQIFSKDANLTPLAVLRHPYQLQISQTLPTFFSVSDNIGGIVCWNKTDCFASYLMFVSFATRVEKSTLLDPSDHIVVVPLESMIAQFIPHIDSLRNQADISVEAVVVSVSGGLIFDSAVTSREKGYRVTNSLCTSAVSFNPEVVSCLFDNNQVNINRKA